jgi:hypothetical protein
MPTMRKYGAPARIRNAVVDTIGAATASPQIAPRLKRRYSAYAKLLTRNANPISGAKPRHTACPAQIQIAAAHARLLSDTITSSASGVPNRKNV